jgi:hypothetical protein
LSFRSASEPVKPARASQKSASTKTLVIPTAVGAPATASGGTCFPPSRHKCLERITLCHPKAAESRAKRATSNEEPAPILSKGPLHFCQRRLRLICLLEPALPFSTASLVTCHIVAICRWAKLIQSFLAQCEGISCSL